jgi:hypothetical protein
MFKVFTLYRLFPTGGSDVTCGSLVIPTAGVCVYGAGMTLHPNKQELYQAIQNDEIIGESIFEIGMDRDATLSSVLYLCDEVEAYDFASQVYQVNWNMRLAPQLISIVRGEMLSVSLSQMGIDPTAMLGKLANVIGALQVGMFKEAGMMLMYATERDAFLTEERIGRYVSLLTSSDMIDYSL